MKGCITVTKQTLKDLGLNPLEYFKLELNRLLINEHERVRLTAGWYDWKETDYLHIWSWKSL
ncbi:MAG: hypothetical protein ACK5OW_00175 [bacterium]|jgi:hypothetical protein